MLQYSFSSFLFIISSFSSAPSAISNLFLGDELIDCMKQKNLEALKFFEENV